MAVSFFSYFHPYLGKIPILTSIFFRWVVQPPTRNISWLTISRSTPGGFMIQFELKQYPPCFSFRWQQANRIMRCVPPNISKWKGHPKNMSPKKCDSHKQGDLRADKKSKQLGGQITKTAKRTNTSPPWKNMDIVGILYMCWGLNSHYFHIIGDGHQPNSRGLYTHYKDSLLKVG